MLIGGYQKLTLIDFPGHIAATVFTLGCNFRCGFCHNPELVGSKASGLMSMADLPEEEFFSFLKSRIGKLEGVCITGGEPTIQPDLVDFIIRIKSLGYKVKIDTNGARPDVLRKIIGENLVDYIAMDIKNSPKNYAVAAGVNVDVQRILLSTKLIRTGRIPYEFRTTVVPGIHREKDILEIAKWLVGSRRYVLQRFVNSKLLDPKVAEILSLIHI